MNDDATELIRAHLDGELTDQQRCALVDWLRQDPGNVDRFVVECRLHSELLDACGGAPRAASEPSDRSGGVTPQPFLVDAGRTSFPPTGIVISDLSVSRTPSSSFGSFAFSYGIAAVLVSIGLLIGWVCHISVRQQVVSDFPQPGASPVHLGPERTFVGRVTGLIDCRWADPKTEALAGAHVLSGRRYALASGLMEITYDTGAKVILEGPCAYQVESQSSGYLTLGKLTARVEKRGEGRGERGENSGDSGKSALLRRLRGDDHRSPSPLSPLPSPLFSVRTPTAIVTDLGTEFGVEVEKSGVTRSHVFRGSVRLQAASADGEVRGPGRVMQENDSARVERGSTGQNGGDSRVVSETSHKPVDFVRTMPKQTIRSLDLVDIVAGGDGYSARNNRGINPTNGRPIDKAIEHEPLVGDGRYHRVEKMPLVDGVFIPSGDRTQVDSVGHTANFPKTCLKAAGGIWTGKDRTGMPDNPAVLGAVDYSSPGHTVLYLHANQGITFDLDAIRRDNPNCKVLRFRAVAGNSETASRRDPSVSADMWVLIDGQVRCQRRKINGLSGPFVVSIPITDRDRFLTLVSTDAGNDIASDWITFGDPRVEFMATGLPSNSKSPQP
jgi:hypothetical protein